MIASVSLSSSDIEREEELLFPPLHGQRKGGSESFSYLLELTSLSVAKERLNPSLAAPNLVGISL